MHGHTPQVVFVTDDNTIRMIVVTQIESMYFMALFRDRYIFDMHGVRCSNWVVVMVLR